MYMFYDIKLEAYYLPGGFGGIVGRGITGGSRV